MWSLQRIITIKEMASKWSSNDSIWVESNPEYTVQSRQEKQIHMQEFSQIVKVSIPDASMMMQGKISPGAGVFPWKQRGRKGGGEGSVHSILNASNNVLSLRMDGGRAYDA